MWEHLAGDVNQAIRVASEGVELARRLGDRDALGLPLTQLGFALYLAGRYDKARVALDEADELAHNAQHSYGRAINREYRAHIDWAEGHTAAAITALRKSAQVMHELGDGRIEATCLIVLGCVALFADDLYLAEQTCPIAFEVAQGCHDRDEAARAGCQLGELARRRGDFDEARRLLTEGLPVFAPPKVSWMFDVGLLWLAHLALDLSRPDLAAATLVAYDGFTDQRNLTPPPPFARLRTQLGAAVDLRPAAPASDRRDSLAGAVDKVLGLLNEL
jgi:ATP/maltotriose-dependent transcriptional regulator MalT